MEALRSILQLILVTSGTHLLARHVSEKVSKHRFSVGASLLGTAVALQLLGILDWGAFVLLSVGAAAAALLLFFLSTPGRRRLIGRHRKWAKLGFLPCLILVTLGFYVQHLSAFEFPRAKEDESLLIISKFKRAEKQSQDWQVESRIKDALISTIETELPQEAKVRIEMTNQVLGEDDAFRFGGKYAANIVIYGETDDAGVKGSVKICTTPGKDYPAFERRIDAHPQNLLGGSTAEAARRLVSTSLWPTQVSMTRPADIHLSMTTELPKFVVCMTTVSLGILYLVKDQTDNHVAKKLFKRAASNLSCERDRHIPYFFLGVTYVLEGSLDLAIETYEKAAEAVPSFLEAHYNLGNTYLKKGLYDEAAAAYKKAIDIDPDCFEAHMNLGAVYFEVGALDEAIAEFKEALSINHDSAETYFNLGLAYYHEVLLDSAICAYEKALEMRPDLAEARLNLAVAYEDKGRLADAESQYREALRRKPDFPEAHNNLGYLYARQHRWDEAIAGYKSAIAINPDFADAHFNLSNVYLDNCLWDGAESESRIALKLNPNDLDARNNLGRAYLGKHLAQEAITEFEEIIKHKPDYTWAYNNLALAYELMGDTAQALRQWKIYLDVAQNDPDHKRRIPAMMQHLENLERKWPF